MPEAGEGEGHVSVGGREDLTEALLGQRERIMEQLRSSLGRMRTAEDLAQPNSERLHAAQEALVKARAELEAAQALLAERDRFIADKSAELDSLRAEKASELAGLRREKALELSRLADEKGAELSRLAAEHAAELARWREDFSRAERRIEELTALSAGQEQKLHEAARHASELESHGRGLAADLAALESRHRELKGYTHRWKRRAKIWLIALGIIIVILAAATVALTNRCARPGPSTSSSAPAEPLR